MEKPCRKCGVKFPATEEYFYRAGNYLNFICKPCMKKNVTAWKTERFDRRSVTFLCETCGKSVTRTVGSESDRRRFCSRECKNQSRNVSRRVDRVTDMPERRCVHCGGDMPRTMRKDAKFCSASCNEAAHNLTRKMVARTGTKKPRGGRLLSRAAIGDRDGWRCGLCGGRVNPKKKNPDPLCGSIDHIVPLARGGTNDPANLQLAHLRCNLRKGQRGEAQQLRLT